MTDENNVKAGSFFGNDPGKKNKKTVISIRKLTCYKDGNGSKHPVKLMSEIPQLIRNQSKHFNLRNDSFVSKIYEG